jgi:hypothetical protein
MIITYSLFEVRFSEINALDKRICFIISGNSPGTSESFSGPYGNIKLMLTNSIDDFIPIMRKGFIGILSPNGEVLNQA